jgi:small subunit ribosomal protein S20
MANSKQAEKRARQAVKLRSQNMSQRSTLRTAIKKVQAAVATGDKAAAQAAFKDTVSTIDQIADKKIIHKNKAARHKSRLSAAVKGLAQA